MNRIPLLLCESETPQQAMTSHCGRGRDERGGRGDWCDQAR